VHENVQVALMETLKERLGKEGQKEERKHLVHEKDAAFLACEMYSRLSVLDEVVELELTRQVI
jgi:hypothetical protein